MKRILLALFFITNVLLVPIKPLHATGFDPGYIISDQELFFYNSMTLADIQAFLGSQPGILKYHVDLDVDGLIKTASSIIYNASQKYRVNPQYLLVLVQKEQGLITDTEPWQSQLDWATGYAVCDECDVDHPIVRKFKGFAKQVDKAAWRTRYYTENNHEFTFKPGFEYNIDGESVFIKNSATAALYNYTPHLRGNKIFHQLWQSWFQSSSYKTGTLLQVFGEPGVWLIKNGKRHPFANKASLTSRFQLNEVIQVASSTLTQYTLGPAIKFPEFSIVSVESEKIYLIVNNEKRWIIDDATFKSLGFSIDEVEQTTESDLEFFTEGTPITLDSAEPTGSLIQDPETFGIYYVKDGVKQPLVAPELLILNFPKMRTRKGGQSELAQYTKGAPVLLRDGLLVKSNQDPTVYIISGGAKHPIDSEYTFNSLGYKWTNIETVSSNLLSLHSPGEAISVQQQLSEEEITQLRLND